MPRLQRTVLGRAVGADQIGRRDIPLLTGHRLGETRTHPGVPRLEVHQLNTEPNLDAMAFQLGERNPLQLALGHRPARVDGAAGPDSLVVARWQAATMLGGSERAVIEHGAHRNAPVPPHPVQLQAQPDRPEQLQGAQTCACPRRCAQWVTLVHDQWAYAPMRQEQRRREPHRARADHQHRYPRDNPAVDRPVLRSQSAQPAWLELAGKSGTSKLPRGRSPTPNSVLCHHR